MDSAAGAHSSGCTSTPGLACSWFSADATISSLQKALYFPNIQGTSMASRRTTHTTDLFKGRVSVVAVLTARVSEVSRYYNRDSFCGMTYYET